MNEVVETSFVEITGSEPKFHKKAYGPKRVLIMSGLPFSGKSHISTLIGERQDDAIIVRSDTIRPIVARHMGRADPLYDQEEHDNTFALGSMLVDKALEINRPVIADATNLKNVYRKWVIEPAEKHGAEHVVVFLKLEASVAVDRALKGTKYDSAATGAVYTMLRKTDKEPIELCTTPYVIIDAESSLNHLDTLAKWLGGKKKDMPELIVPDNE